MKSRYPPPEGNAAAADTLPYRLSDDAGPPALPVRSVGPGCSLWRVTPRHGSRSGPAAGFVTLPPASRLQISVAGWL